MIHACMCMYGNLTEPLHVVYYVCELVTHQLAYSCAGYSTSWFILHFKIRTTSVQTRINSTKKSKLSLFV